MLEELKTERLLLRPMGEADAERLANLANNWNVARMLSRMPYPYTLDMAQDWIGRQKEMREEGEEFVYAIENGEGFVGTCGLQAHADGTHEIGYWVGEPYWNRGYASEAAGALLAEAANRFGAGTLISGHFWENHTSGRVLTKLGFRYTGEESRWCVARQENVRCLTMRLARTES
ncbi:GNAT family N-acetyltransferase [Parvibaculum sp.]|uniref:GNAT family N-acetyltransferase n=1 Tax=Parvibaculum sp. TaxID=2024848 RepID=UPI001B0BA82F|nr:GNAT family N-acetyltransferase [Parvibaculum sp.]MBO6668613.1 GNAT family N-acetyltransferase [Parvibaculum sp.]MBO6691067.1 GNAT family N-acetyltransferase [Parvibaculum sp.]MBO6714289.1 GNAT family N-acetyltransferase [Parvibaculum sp.]